MARAAVPWRSLPPAESETLPPDDPAADPTEAAPAAAPYALGAFLPEGAEAAPDQSFRLGAFLPDAAPEDEPGNWSVIGRAALRGAIESGTAAAQAPTAFKDRGAPAEQTDRTSRILNEPLSEGWSDPTWWAAHIAHGVAGSAPSLAAGAAGAAGAQALFPEAPGAAALAGGAGGYAVGSMITEIAPAYQKARAAGLDHDAAVTRAIEETGIAGAFGAVSGVLPAGSAFGKDAVGALKRPISEALLQVFGAQPIVGAAQQETTGLVEGKQPTAAELATGYAENVGVGAGLVGGHAVLRAIPDAAQRLPLRESPPEAPGTAASPGAPEPPPSPAGLPSAAPAGPETPPPQPKRGARGAAALPTPVSAADVEAAVNAGEAPATSAAAPAPPTGRPGSGGERPGPGEPPTAPEATGAPPAPQASAQTPVPPTVPEPAADVHAQITALADPKNPKDAVFLAAGTPLPPNLSSIDGLHVASRPEGTLLTTNPAKADAYRTAQAVSDPLMAHLLGYPETKPEAIASGNPVVVQGTDPAGAVVAETLASPQGVPAAEAAVQAQTPPGGTVAVRPPEDVTAERAQETAAEGTQPPAPRLRTIDQIMREDGVGAKAAAATQADEIAAIGRPISMDEMAARKAGVAAMPPSAPSVPPLQPSEPGSGGYTMFTPSELTAEPGVMQFKASDEKGVTGALTGFSTWETGLANPITVWQTNDGRNVVVNGHQRLDLAQRAEAAGQQGVQLPARVYREADGYSPEYMRALGAYQNIAEGSGTPLDAARVLRTKNAFPETMRLPELPPHQMIVQQARGLAQLSPEAFGAVENGLVPPEYAGMVGAVISEPAEQMAALDALSRGQPANANQARIMIADIRNGGFLQGAQTTLFGEEAFARSLVPERAKVLDGAMKILRSAAAAFRATVRGEKTLTDAGNVLATDANVQGKTASERLLDTIGRNATTVGPYSDALNVAARELAAGKPLDKAAHAFLAAARQLERGGTHPGVPAGDHGRGVGHAGEGEAGGLALGRRAPLPPSTDAPLFGETAREQTPRAAAEPTIRTDERQAVMPGMERSAVQAQAARDQAGPRGGQQPANEGLFAPKPPDQKPLFGRHAQVPLYSAVERAVSGLKQEKGTGEQFAAQLAKVPGVKPEELKWLGLDTWLRQQKTVAKQQIADYVRANQLDVQEVLKGNDETLAQMEPELRAIGITKPLDKISVGDLEDAGADKALQRRFWYAIGNGPRTTKFGNYQLPGGQNYRELLITMPPKAGESGDAIAQRMFGKTFRELSGSQKAAAQNEANRADREQTYRGPHWDERNVLGHVRFSERTAPDGKRVLHIEELQSDLHQRGRKEGYQEGQRSEFAPVTRDQVSIEQTEHQYVATGPEGETVGIGKGTVGSEDEAKDYAARYFSSKNAELTHAAHALASGRVPSLPFKTTWPALLMKRMIRYAVDNGFDRVAWTPGDEQAKRYDLSKHIKSVVLHDNSSGGIGRPRMEGPFERGTLEAFDHDGRRVLDKTVTSAQEIADLIGKEAADKLLAVEPKEARRAGLGVRERALRDQQLHVGGEGMRGFYDRMLPTETQKIVGKFGAKVGKSEIREPANVNLTGWENTGNHQPEGIAHQVHSFDITPALRSAVLDQGLPLFQRGAMQGHPDYPHPTAIQSVIDTARAITGGHIQIEAYDAAHHAFTVKFPDGHTEQVFGYAIGRLIRAAIEPGRFRQNLNHEVLHALKRLGVFTPQEWATLEAAAERGNWIEKHGVRDRYPEMDHVGQIEEAIADEMGDRAAATPAPGSTPSFITRMLAKVRSFMARLRNMLARRGFQTADDVFGKALSGEVGAREPGSRSEPIGPQTVDESVEAAQAWGLRDPNEAALGRRPEDHPLKESMAAARELSRILGDKNSTSEEIRAVRLRMEAAQRREGQPTAPPGLRLVAPDDVAFGRRQTETPEFRNWFGDSRVVDAAGEPKRMFHGSREPGIEAFSRERASPEAMFGPGFYFTDSPDVAGSTGGGRDEHEIAAKAAFNQAGYAWQAAHYDSAPLTPRQMARAKRLLWSKQVLRDAHNDIGTRQTTAAGQRAVLAGEPQFREWLNNQGWRWLRETIGVERLPTTSPTTYPVYLSIKRPFDADARITAAAARDMVKSAIAAAPREGLPAWRTGEADRAIERRIQSWNDAVPQSAVFESVAAELGNTGAAAALQRAGYDGIHMEGGATIGTFDKHDVWVAFDPTQVKSAVGNIGAFDPNDPRLAFGRKPLDVPAPDEDPEKAPPIKTAADMVARLERIPRIGHVISAAAEKFTNLRDTAQMMVTPMAAHGASDQARAIAKNYANLTRWVAWDYNRIIDWGRKTFKPDRLKAMWDAADADSIEIQTAGKPLDTGHGGVADLHPDEQAAVKAWQADADNALAQARKVGMTEAEGLPSYAPRMVVDMVEGAMHPFGQGGEGARAQVVRNMLTLPLATMHLRQAIAGRALINQIKAVGSQTGQRTVSEGGVPEDGGSEQTEKRAPSSPGAAGGQDFRTFGTNVRTTTPQLLHRKHLTTEETEAAANRKRAAMQDQEFRWFTIKGNPAFWTRRARLGTDAEGNFGPLHDENGNILVDRVPIYVRGDFEGPLKAVLHESASGPVGRAGQALYHGMMSLKGRMMTSIMYGVAHLGVIAGRAFPAAPNLYRVIRTGSEMKQDQATMRRLILGGMAPIGRTMGFRDLPGLIEDPQLVPGRSWMSKIAAFVPGLYSPKWSDATKRAIDRIGDVAHNKLVWDQVQNIQVGLAVQFEQHLIDKGMAPSAATRMAANFANIYAGALPREAMSQGARALANVLLFSRSYRLGNIAAIKAGLLGLPRDVRSQILREHGEGVAKLANSLARRKGIAVLMADMALYYIGNSLIQSAFNVMLGLDQDQEALPEGASVSERLGVEAHGYLRRLVDEGKRLFAHPQQALNPFGMIESLSSLYEHEPEKRNRIMVGYDKDGTAEYMRNPTGKSAEDISDYFVRFLDTAKRMLSPFMRPIQEVWTNDLGFGHKVYDPMADMPTEVAQITGALTSSVASSTFPWAARLVSAYEGHETFSRALTEAAAAGLGTSISKGYPGGPPLGELSAARESHEFTVQRAMPGIRDMIRRGDSEGAAAKMTELGVEPGLQRYIFGQTENPTGSKRQLKDLMLYGTPEQQRRIFGTPAP